MKNNGIADAQIKDFFTTAISDNPFEDKVPLKLYTIRPDAPLGGGPGGLNFDPAEMTVMLNKGISATNAFVASLPQCDVTWA